MIGCQRVCGALIDRQECLSYFTARLRWVE